MQLLRSAVLESPELLVFLSLGLGYLVGKIRIKGFGLGSTASVLLVAMAVGQLGIEVPSLLKNVSFALFAFCVGYQVGPQFFGSFRKDGLNYMWISLAVALVGLATAVVLGKVLHFDAGTTAGLFAGSMTQSAVIGTAEGAVSQLGLSAAQKASLNAHIAVAYAITYVFGTVGVILFFKILPRLMRIDLKQAARDLEAHMGGTSELSKSPALFSWSRMVSLRAYEVKQPGAVGQTVSGLEKQFPWRVAIDRIHRRGQLLAVTPNTALETADVVVIGGLHKGLVAATNLIGPEVDISEVADVIGEVMDVCVLNSGFVGKTLLELGQRPEAHGIFLRKITRQGRELPLTPETMIQKCDVVQILGSRDLIERAVAVAGYAERPTAATDLVMVGLGCVAGTLFGMLSVTVGGVPISVGVGGGVLLSGLVFGWLRSIRPTFGQIPDGGQWILTDVGLNLFIACIGLGSGKQAVAAMQTNGLEIFLAGAVLAIVPIVAGVLFGRYVLRMNPVLLLGALTGARVIPAALTALEEDAESPMLTLGFAAPFAFANVFLTILGSVIIHLM